MPETMDELLATTPEALREQAVRRVRKRRDLYSHAFVYVAINAMLWAIWALTDTGGYPWPLWVTLAWGLGLVFNAWDVFLRRPISSEEIDREVRRLQQGGHA